MRPFLFAPSLIAPSLLAPLSAALLLLAVPALAQTADAPPDPDQPDIVLPDILPDILPLPEPPLPPELEPGAEEDADPDGDPDADPDAPPDAGLLNPPLPPAPDYSALPPRAEKEARLQALFERLGGEEDAARAKLVSEEIWALWMDSGSASVNYLLTRADSAQRAGRTREARRFFDLMTGLEPAYAEAWSRSARLALDEEDFSRAVADATEALVREPRHFYALWTLGNVLERVGRSEEALEVYEEAHALFPLLEGVKTRLDALRGEVLGEVL